MGKAELAKTDLVFEPKEGQEEGKFVRFGFMTEARPPLFARLSELPEGIRDRMALAELRRKIQQSYQDCSAGAEAYDVALEAYESLILGVWQEGRGESPLWILAFAEAANKSKEEAADAWAKLDDKMKRALKVDARIKAIKARLDLEKAEAKAKGTKESEGIDLGALF